MRYLYVTVALAFFWVVLSGHFAPLLLGFLFAPVGWLGLRHQDKLKAALAKGDAEPLDLA